MRYHALLINSSRYAIFWLYYLKKNMQRWRAIVLRYFCVCVPIKNTSVWYEFTPVDHQVGAWYWKTWKFEINYSTKDGMNRHQANEYDNVYMVPNHTGYAPYFITYTLSNYVCKIFCCAIRCCYCELGLYWVYLITNIVPSCFTSTVESAWSIPVPLMWTWVIWWWRHQMEAVSAVLALCEWNSPTTGGFPSQRHVTRSFYVCFFYLRLGKRLSKQSTRRWFETP